MKVTCPICKAPVQWQGNPDRPFCSERCKSLDLGHWAEGSYALPTDEMGEETQSESQD